MQIPKKNRDKYPEAGTFLRKVQDKKKYSNLQEETKMPESLKELKVMTRLGLKELIQFFSDSGIWSSSCSLSHFFIPEPLRRKVPAYRVFYPDFFSDCIDSNQAVIPRVIICLIKLLIIC